MALITSGRQLLGLALIELRPAWSPAGTVPGSSLPVTGPRPVGKRLRVCIDGGLRTCLLRTRLQRTLEPADSGPAHYTQMPKPARRGTTAQLGECSLAPPEAADSMPTPCASQLSPVVGRMMVGDFCHVLVSIKGIPCTALVDTGSSVTHTAPCLLASHWEPTTVHLRTVPRGLLHMQGKGLM
ncbi:hypothetical protein EOD39_7887 [Acipenser ruthenus]|uniref:Uncharacterized protein n=1 Tax=Acipenser ruthenus TaxID=7906 RepID=A0A444U5R0_ACIRT|nr:hypothetical protein EOD39_7887 [Acipenser ruthenus]